MLNGNVLTPGVTRKCPMCGTNCVVDASSLDDFVFYQNKYYHEECFNKAVKALKSEKKQIKTLEQYPIYKQESKARLTEAYDIDCLYCFLLRYYGITVIPNNFWTKITELAKGEYQHVSVAIPYNHLYDMWRRKANYLNKIAEDNRTKGKDMSPQQRLNYDLAVLINQYDSYLRFLEKEKIKQAESELEKKPSVSVNDFRQKAIRPSEPDDTDIDINDILDEVFNNG